MQYSIVRLSEIAKTYELRIDAEYWLPSFIKNSQLVDEDKKIKDFIIRDISNIKSSPIHKNFEYLEISNIPLNSFEYETIKVQEGEEPDRAHYILQKGDVVVSTVRPNRNAVAFIDRSGIIGSSGLAVLRAKNIEPEYLFAFCKTDYFIQCLMRKNKASMYPAVSNTDILETALFVPSESFRKTIRENIRQAVSYAEKSKNMFAKAQTLLLSELGLTHYKPRHQLSFIKRYSDIEREGRMDAEYFQPKYEELIKKIKNYKGGWNTLKNIISLKDKNFKPDEKKLYKYIELSHISQNGTINSYITEKGKNLPSRARRIVSTKDIIISSVEGSLEKIALIDKEHDQSICSTGFYVIRSKSINSETMLLLMKIIVGYLQLKKGCKGVILSAISKDEFYKIILPVLNKNIQKKIQNIVVELIKLRKKSKELLKHSKHAVETAIKQNEKIALAWLKTSKSS